MCGQEKSSLQPDTTNIRTIREGAPSLYLCKHFSAQYNCQQLILCSKISPCFNRISFLSILHLVCSTFEKTFLRKEIEREVCDFYLLQQTSFPLVNAALLFNNPPPNNLQTLEPQDVFFELRPQDDPSVPAGLLRLHRRQDHHLQGRRRLGGQEAAGRHRHTGSQMRKFKKGVSINVMPIFKGHLWAESCITRLLSPFFKKALISILHKKPFRCAVFLLKMAM